MVKCVPFVLTLPLYFCFQGLKEIADSLSGSIDGPAPDAIVQEGGLRLEDQPRTLMRFEFKFSSQVRFSRG